jgi:predicted PurR-regulated permease PerM
MDNIYLKLIALIIVLIIIFIVFLILNNNTKTHSPQVIKKIVNKLNETTPVVNNKINVITEKDKIKLNLELFKYKHTKFLKNLDNSIEFCVDNNKFILAEHITQYKLLYVELYNIKLEEEKLNPKVDLTTNEDFLLKLDRLDKLNNIIQKQN